MSAMVILRRGGGEDSLCTSRAAKWRRFGVGIGTSRMLSREDTWVGFECHLPRGIAVMIS